MAGTYTGNDYANTVYQDDYDSDLDIYTYGGNDKIYLNLTGSAGGFNYVEAGSGNDFLRNSYEGGNKIYLGSGNDTYFGNGYNTGSNYDKVSGGDGNDKFDVGTYQSDYYGDAGNDSFFSVGFNNYFNGGSGRDLVSYETQDSDADLAGRGVKIDLYDGYAKTFGTNYKEVLVSIEDAVGSGAADDIYATDSGNKLWGDGGSDLIKAYGGNDLVYGGSGNDYLYGGSGDDKISGDSNNDKLWGGTGNDNLYGGSGNDILNGEAGNDYLYGRTGADTFYFGKVSDSTPNSARDVIFDFSRKENDFIDLRAIDADTTRGGNQSFDFISKAGFSGEAGELRFSGGILSGDVNGDGRSDFQVEVSKYTVMYSDDFYL